MRTQQIPRRRPRDNAKGKSNGRRPVHGCSSRTSVAARLSLRTTDGESHETVRSALWHRAATARARVLSVSRGGLPPIGDAGADHARSRCLSAVAALAACEHRPSTRKRKRSANRLRTRCGRAYNRYGCKCQDHSPSLHQPTVAPHMMRGSAVLQALRFRKAAGPRVKHGEAAGNPS